MIALRGAHHPRAREGLTALLATLAKAPRRARPGRAPSRRSRGRASVGLSGLADLSGLAGLAVLQGCKRGVSPAGPPEARRDKGGGRPVADHPRSKGGIAP